MTSQSEDIRIDIRINVLPLKDGAYFFDIIIIILIVIYKYCTMKFH